jgi:hypothetical protein
MDEKGESGFPEPMYFIVFCAKNELALANIEAPLTLVADKENSVYAEWSRTYRENAESRKEIESLRAALSQVRHPQPATSSPVAASVAQEHWLVRLARKIAD